MDDLEEFKDSDDNDYYYESQPIYESKNRYVHPSIHIMNKAESKLLRRIKSESGLSEEEIREHKKYRKMLSEAQKEGEKAKRTYWKKRLDNVMKSVTKDFKLAKEHPLVIAEFNKRFRDIYHCYPSSYFIF